ncbi:MAG: hypothetical protein NVS3B10_23940 [Polyangiales bacterium]
MSLPRRLASLPVVLALAAISVAPACRPPASGASGAAAASAPEVPLATASLPGSRLRLRLPDGFARPTRAPLLVDDQHDIRLSIVELTLASAGEGDGALKGASDRADQKYGPTAKRTTIHHGDTTGFYVVAEREGRIESLCVLRQGAAVAIVGGNYAMPSAAVFDAIVGSMWVDSTAALDLPTFYGIALGTVPGLQVWDATSQPMMLKEPDAHPPIPPTSPTLALMVVPIANKEDVEGAVGALLEKSHVERGSLAQKKVTIDGSQAIELTGPASENGTPVRFFSTIIDEPGAVIVVWGHYGPQRKEVLDHFRTVIGKMHRADGVIGPVHLP